MAKAKRGRPKIPAEQAKRIPLNMRTTQQLRTKVEKAAEESGRSLAQEIEFRVERSFVDDERYLLAGGENLIEITRLIAAAARTASLLEQDGGSLLENADRYAIFEAAVIKILARLRPSPSRHQKNFLEQVGQKIAEMHCAARSEEVAAAIRETMEK